MATHIPAACSEIPRRVRAQAVIAPRGAFRSTTPIRYVEKLNSLHKSRLRQVVAPKKGAHCFEEGPFRGGEAHSLSCQAVDIRGS